VYRIALEGLSESECAAYIAVTFGVRPSDEAAAAVHARTDGNPFFVGELARLLASEGALERELGAGLASNAVVPPGVRDVVRRRLTRLPQRTNDLLTLAAVLGRDVDLAVLATAGRIEEHEVVDLLDAAVAVGILLEDEAVVGRYRFSHALVQETVLREVGLTRQAKLHARAAVALRVVYGSDRDHVAQIANHRFLGMPVVPPEEAYESLIEAAAVAQRRLAYEMAELQLRRALEVTGRMRGGQERAQRELDVQHRLATLLSVTEGYQSAAVEEAWSRARELCRTLGNTPEVFASLWGLARICRTRGQFDLSMKFGDELLDLAKTSPSVAFAVAGHDVVGLASFFTGDLETADRHLSELLSVSGDPLSPEEAVVLALDPHVVVHGYLANVRWLRGHEDEASRFIHEARRLAGGEGQRLSRAVALLYAVKLASMQDRPRETQEVVAQWYRLAEQGPLGPLETVTDLMDGWARARSGDAAGGTAAIAEAVKQLRAADWRLAFSYFLALQADALRAAGDLDAALAAAKAGLEEANATGEHYYEAELCRLIAEIMIARRPSATSNAATWLRRALAIADAQGAVQFRRRAEQSLARLAQS
jgi:predicted ATPase